MLGTKGKQPTTLDGKTMEPIEAHGLFSNSIGYLVPDENAMVWRGPMASKAFAQLANETHWPDIDYLVIDMPPGTGDIQLSLAQHFQSLQRLLLQRLRIWRLRMRLREWRCLVKSTCPCSGW